MVVNGDEWWLVVEPWWVMILDNNGYNDGKIHVNNG